MLLRKYSLKKKKEIVSRHLDKGASISLLSSEYGIPATTIRRWVKAYREYGQKGLADMRRKPNHCVNRDHDAMCQIAQEAMDMTNDSTDEAQQIILSLVKELGAFKDRGFITYLYYLCRLCIIMIQDSHGDSKDGVTLSYEERERAYMGARMLLLTIPHQDRRETEKMFEHLEVIVYSTEFMKNVCKVYEKKCA